MRERYKICFVTAARSEYGVLRWLMQEVKDDPEFTLQIIVTGSHLSPEFGNTYKEVEKDGFTIDEKVDMHLASSSKSGIVKSMGFCAIGMADAFEKLNPDLLVVLGDRYELLPICSSALVMNIPIAHISGGDITEGAIDDQVRNAVTKMAVLHFPGTKDSADRIIQMGEKRENVYIVGEPGLDNFNRLTLLSKEELARKFNLDLNKKWVLMTYHPETMISVERNIAVAENIIDSLKEISGVQVIITKANADYGGIQINEYFNRIAINDPEKFKFFDSLGQLGYISLMKYSDCLIGNTSSGIIEAPMLNVPVINIGDRQKGRYLSKNIISANGDVEDIRESLIKVCSPDFKRSAETKNYYGDGNTSKRIYQILKERLLNRTIDVIKAV